jgi:hypothetical protein
VWGLELFWVFGWGICGVGGFWVCVVLGTGAGVGAGAGTGMGLGIFIIFGGYVPFK